jgi:Glycosyl hydrolase family 115/Gylcosyl hydrolase family 115 C-terminal domain
MKKRFLLLLSVLSAISPVFAQGIITEKKEAGSFSMVAGNSIAAIYFDAADFAVVNKAATLLQQDIEMVTGKKPLLINKLSGSEKNIIVIGTVGQSALISQLVKEKKINADKLTGKWEAYQLQTIAHPFTGAENALVIAGSDRRGTAFGVFELSRQIGVSPWYWWADVPVKKKASLYVKKSILVNDAPKVKYRGIFINDEAPALSGWSKSTFGGFNSKFYAKVFELILRLKGNYLWPAMWGNAFYDDDSLNIKMADEYAVVIGTSHHEPLMRAHDEWKRYGKGKWNYDSNEARLKDFWKTGMQRATNEKIVSVGMRGDGDEPMSRETATSLLERIVKDQRQIIEDVTKKPASETPQLWALYKEVQDYYDKGMRVPDDVTLLLCDDNWGNIRKLPAMNASPRKGGYGIYYHFDYVGDPRNYKWLNTNPIPRVWEQMHLAYEHKVKDIWIVNVGDIKPMEFPISFFLDYAWNPDRIDAADIKSYTEKWCAAQFGKDYAVEIADILAKYAKYNGRRKPELLNENTYGINYGEFVGTAVDYSMLQSKAEAIYRGLPEKYKDSYFELILFPVKACANLQGMYSSVYINHYLASKKDISANAMAETVKKMYANDSLLTLEYHTIANGKWNHMMSQTHIGYTYWQQPNVQKMPELKYVSADSAITPVKPEMMLEDSNHITSQKLIPANAKGNIFYEKDGYVSIEAAEYTKAVNRNSITWKVLPDLGRTGSAVTTFPVTSANQAPGANTPQLQYEIYVYDSGAVKLQAYFSPTLNFNNDEGLKYAVSIDDEAPQIIVLNKEDNQQKIWAKWVADNIIIKTTTHTISKPGKHVLKYWMVSPAVVLQKLVIDLGGLKESYLGPPETKQQHGSKTGK